MRAVAAAMLIVLPAMFYVSQRTHAATTGYAILRLRQETAILQTDNARLVAMVARLRSPDRIDHIATAALGLAPPRPQQIATLAVAPVPVVAAAPPPWSLRDRFVAWLVRGQAEAREFAR